MINIRLKKRSGVEKGFAIAGIFILIAVGFVFISLILSRILQPRKYSPEKFIPYECGENPVGSAWIQYNFRYYIYALLFLIFDVEVVLLYPVLVVFKQLKWLAFAEIWIFIVILLLPYIYIWSKGDLQWFIKKEEKSGIDRQEASR